MIKERTFMDESYYGRLCAAFYDADKPSAPEVEMAVYEALLKDVKGPVLEPMCGSGRFLCQLHDRGHDIHGFDISPQMILACQQKLSRPERVCVATFETYSSRREFEACVIPAGSFSLLGASQAESALDSILRYLADDGFCHIEYLTRDDVSTGRCSPSSKLTSIGNDRWVCAISTSVWSESIRTELATCHYIEFDSARMLSAESERYELRRYDPEEMEAMVSRQGYCVVDHRPRVFGDGRNLLSMKPGGGCA